MCFSFLFTLSFSSASTAKEIFCMGGEMHTWREKLLLAVKKPKAVHGEKMTFVTSSSCARFHPRGQKQKRLPLSQEIGMARSVFATVYGEKGVEEFTATSFNKKFPIKSRPSWWSDPWSARLVIY